MFFLLKFFVYFTISFLILCIPMGNHMNLFDKIYIHAYPLMEQITKGAKKQLKSTSNFTEKLFTNSKPASYHHLNLNNAEQTDSIDIDTDEVSVGLSAREKQDNEGNSQGHYKDYLNEEKEIYKSQYQSSLSVEEKKEILNSLEQ
jgi:hypothetical protein